MMDKMPIDESWSEFWTSGRYVLLRKTNGDIAYSIVERATGRTEIIEDDHVYSALICRMRAEGVPTFSELPAEAKEHEKRVLELVDSGATAKEINDALRCVNQSSGQASDDLTAP